MAKDNDDAHPSPFFDGAGNRISPLEFARQALPIRPLTENEEWEDRSHADRLLGEGTCSNPLWLHRLLRVYATLDRERAINASNRKANRED